MMNIKKNVDELNTVKQVQAKILEAKDAQEHAFNHLINEKLEADESFRIFMDLSKETLNELRLKFKDLYGRHKSHIYH